ncbi:unnamed protein product [Pedinophyceae sp. YPF-701]|nr:unnamed protein product [Pedinophyceae sp. YPF-701]
MSTQRQGAATSQRNQWHTSLFDCFSTRCDTCVLGCCLPCYLHGRITSRLSGGSVSALEASIPSFVVWGTQWCGSGLVRQIIAQNPCLFVVNFMWWPGFVTHRTRKQLMRKYNIEPDPVPPLLLHLCCYTCALCQEAREIEHREPMSGLGVRRQTAPPQQPSIS